MDKVEIRKAKREDCKRIHEIIQELADFEKMPNGPKIDLNTLIIDGFDTNPPSYYCHVALFNGQIVGYAIYYYTYSTWLGRAMYLEDLCVTSSHRGKHIGEKLLKAVATEALNNNCCRIDFVVLQWNPAKNFYRKFGAEDITESEEWHVHRLSYEAIKNLVETS